MRRTSGPRRTTRPRHAVLAALLAALTAVTVTTACGSPATGKGDPGSSDEARPGKGRRIDSRVLWFANDLRPPHLVRTVLRTPEDAARFPGWFAGASVDGDIAPEVAARLRHADLTRHVVVGYVAVTGCSQAGGARLVADGDRVTVALLDHPKPPSDCYAPYEAVALFEVPKERMPKSPVFGSPPKAPDPAGPGESLAFTRVDSPAPPDVAERAELTDPSARERYLERLPDATARSLERQLAEHAPGRDDRVFGFVVSACRATGARLWVSADEGLTARAEGGENVRCLRAEHQIAVFSLAAPLVPENPLGPPAD